MPLVMFGNIYLVPTLCVGMPCQTLCVDLRERDAERLWMHSHAERGNEEVNSDSTGSA